MLKSPIITDRGDVGGPAEWLHNPHAGEILSLDFMEPLAMSADMLAEHVGVPSEVISAVVDGSTRMDGEMDARLGRYFGMSPGFFLGLQLDYELLEARRRHADALDRIVPRAA